MLKVVSDTTYKVTVRANAEAARFAPALTKVGNQVIVFAGDDSNHNPLHSVSCHDLVTNIWLVDLPKINQARSNASGCYLPAYVYIFAGYTKDESINNIEKIASISLYSNCKEHWQLIEIPQNIFTPRQNPAVAPLNDTDIVIMGGWHGGDYLNDVVVFDTTNK